MILQVHPYSSMGLLPDVTIAAALVVDVAVAPARAENVVPISPRYQFVVARVLVTEGGLGIGRVTGVAPSKTAALPQYISDYSSSLKIIVGSTRQKACFANYSSCFISGGRLLPSTPRTEKHIRREGNVNLGVLAFKPLLVVKSAWERLGA